MDKKAMYNITYGLYLLTTKEEKDNGCIINTAVQIANDPTRISISVLKDNLTCDMILRTGVFNISAISEQAPFSLFQHFGLQSGRDVDKFADYADASRSENGCYYLTKNSNMYLSGKVVQSLDLGSHMLFIAEVTDGEVLSQESSVTYTYYQKNIKPKPTAEKTEKKQWVCTVCGYTYEGDELPDDFVCPWCKHGRDDFELVVK